MPTLQTGVSPPSFSAFCAHVINFCTAAIPPLATLHWVFNDAIIPAMPAIETAGLEAMSAMHLHNFGSAAGSNESSDDAMPLMEAMQSDDMPTAARAAASPPPMTTGDDCPPSMPPGGNVTPLWA